MNILTQESENKKNNAPEGLQTFQLLYEKVYGESLKREDAVERAERLKRFVKIIYNLHRMQ